MRRDLETTLPRDDARGRGSFPALVPVRASASGDEPSRRYELRAVLGEGGMGEVLLCHDLKLGRDIAMKRLVTESDRPPRLVDARFLREAQVQSQLEHPAIVPVHDLGIDDRGSAFFTMRRVRGRTLADVLDDLRAEVAHTAGEYTLHKLLASYARVCLAVHYAHTRGVIHRDIKPANVMFGDFGEVYVIDWGVARIDDGIEDGQGDGEAPPEQSGERLALPALGAATERGALVGTPAYMAPEQARGETALAPADIYALGAILFEILTLEPLHEDPFHRSIAVNARASERARHRNVPPELEAICVRATAHDPSDRHETARDLAHAVEQFLSGDRDLATRRELSARHVARARELARAAVDSPDPSTDRGRAIEEVGRAIALDPRNEEALELLVGVMREPPKHQPEEVARELETIDVAARRVGLRRAILFYGIVGPVLFLPAWLLMGVKSPLLAALFIGALWATGLAAFWAHRDSSLTRTIPWPSVAIGIVVAISAVCFGPFLFAPMLAVVNTMAHVIVGRREHRFKIVAIGAASLLVPLALELTGICAPTFSFHDGSLTITSPMVHLRGAIAAPFFVTMNVGLVVAASLGLRRYRDAIAKGEERSVTQAWLLRHLVPERARAATSDPPQSL